MSAGKTTARPSRRKQAGGSAVARNVALWVFLLTASFAFGALVVSPLINSARRDVPVQLPAASAATPGVSASSRSRSQATDARPRRERPPGPGISLTPDEPQTNEPRIAEPRTDVQSTDSPDTTRTPSQAEDGTGASPDRNAPDANLSPGDSPARSIDSDTSARNRSSIDTGSPAPPSHTRRSRRHRRHRTPDSNSTPSSPPAAEAPVQHGDPIDQ